LPSLPWPGGLTESERTAGSVAEFGGTMPAGAGSVNDRGRYLTHTCWKHRRSPLGPRLAPPENRQIISVSKRACEYGLSTASGRYRVQIQDTSPIVRHFRRFSWQKRRFANCHKNVFFAVDTGERPNLYTHPSARRTALYGLTARLRNPHWFSENASDSHRRH